MLETPFSVAGNTLDNPRGDLGVFFKEVQSAPQIMTECNEMTDACLEVQLNSLGDQLMAYENKYDDLPAYIGERCKSNGDSGISKSLAHPLRN